MNEQPTSKPFAYAQRSGFRRDDYTVEWPDSSVGMLTEGEAKMWAAHMNEAYEAGRRSHEPAVRPVAWMYTHHTPDSPSGPAETDADFEYGDDQPGPGWTPLYLHPQPPPADEDGERFRWLASQDESGCYVVLNDQSFSLDELRAHIDAMRASRPTKEVIRKPYSNPKGGPEFDAP